MNDNKNTNNEEYIIDNRLESFPFFPIRFVFYIIAICCLALTIFSIVRFNIGGMLTGLIFFAATFSIAIIQKRITVNIQANKYRGIITFGVLKKANGNPLKDLQS